MTTSPFGRLPTGETVEAFTLTNAIGFSIKAITYGATVTSLRVPDREGFLADVVLGFDNLEGYLRKPAYMGAMIGRVAGRSRPHFVLEGETYELVANEKPNHLHGGAVGFDQRLWSAEAREDSVRFTYHSPDGEEGYPGTVHLEVTYTVTGENTLVIDAEATTDQATPLSLTHHSYFNLSGEGSIEDHELQITADTYVPVDESMAVLSRRVGVEPRNDFNKARRIGDVLPELYRSHGDLYFLRSTDEGVLKPVARVYDPASGRVLSVSTTEDYLQLYTGSALDGSMVGKSGKAYSRFAGLCLECEGYPDGANTRELGNIILYPGQLYRSTTIYAFSTQ